MNNCRRWFQSRLVQKSPVKMVSSLKMCVQDLKKTAWTAEPIKIFCRFFSAAQSATWRVAIFHRVVKKRLSSRASTSRLGNCFLLVESATTTPTATLKWHARTSAAQRHYRHLNLEPSITSRPLLHTLPVLRKSVLTPTDAPLFVLKFFKYFYRRPVFSWTPFQLISFAIHF